MRRGIEPNRNHHFVSLSSDWACHFICLSREGIFYIYVSPAFQRRYRCFHDTERRRFNWCGKGKSLHFGADLVSVPWFWPWFIRVVWFGPPFWIQTWIACVLSEVRVVTVSKTPASISRPTTLFRSSSWSASFYIATVLFGYSPFALLVSSGVTIIEWAK